MARVPPCREAVESILMTGALALLSPGEAQRLTQRIKITASGVRDGLFKLRNLVDEAKRSNAWNVLGYPSWTAYLADTLADEPMRLGRDERQELVGYLSGEGLSTRAIAPIVGVDQKTVSNDLRREEFSSPVPEPVVLVAAPVEHPEAPRAATAPSRTTVQEYGGAVPPTSEERQQLRDALANRPPVEVPPRVVTGLDGKSYTPKPREPKPVLVGDSLEKFDADSNSKSLGDTLRVLERIASPAHRDHLLNIWWPVGQESVAPTARDLFTPAHLRDFATALLAFADELEAQL